MANYYLNEIAIALNKRATIEKEKLAVDLYGRRNKYEC